MKQLDKRVVWLFFFSFSGRAILASIAFPFFLLAILADGGESGDVPFIQYDVYDVIFWYVLFLVVLLAIAFVWAKLTYHFYRYELTELGFRKESGVIYKKYVTVPYTRIQNVDINRGIIARLLGLSDLHVQTAGASASVSQYGAFGIGSEGRLPGVSKAEAEVLRDDLVKRAHNASRGQGL